MVSFQVYDGVGEWPSPLRRGFHHRQPVSVALPRCAQRVRRCRRCATASRAVLAMQKASRPCSSTTRCGCAHHGLLLLLIVVAIFLFCCWCGGKVRGAAVCPPDAQTGSTTGSTGQRSTTDCRATPHVAAATASPQPLRGGVKQECHRRRGIDPRPVNDGGASKPLERVRGRSVAR
jgi:hypothetical protein